MTAMVHERMMDLADDGAEPCECCGIVGPCACELDTMGGVDSETGPWSDTVCFTHDRRV